MFSYICILLKNIPREKIKSIEKTQIHQNDKINEAQPEEPKFNERVQQEKCTIMKVKRNKLTDEEKRLKHNEYMRNYRRKKKEENKKIFREYFSERIFLINYFYKSFVIFLSLKRNIH